MRSFVYRLFFVAIFWLFLGFGSSCAEPPEKSTGEELPESLKSVASAWETDWTKHTVPFDEIFSGGVWRDGIPSIDETTFESTTDARSWLSDAEPVIVLEIDGDARAYPLQILTRHEIVNDVVGGVPVVVTFCPLCNSAIVMDRRVDGAVYEFGVSGLLRNSDLIMYDRTTESLWQQFTGEGIVGEHAGDRLVFIPSAIVSFSDFRDAYPDGVVLSRGGRTYGINPYTLYDETEESPFLFFGELDERLPSMMRVVGIVSGGHAVAYPYTLLAEEKIVHDTVGGEDIVIFFRFGTNSALGETIIAEAEDIGAATVYEPSVSGNRLIFRFDGVAFVDEETGSTWNMLGVAETGPLAGETLTPVIHSDHFWFSWAAFYPDTDIHGTN
jgi:hypothetical protein